MFTFVVLPRIQEVGSRFQEFKYVVSERNCLFVCLLFTFWIIVLRYFYKMNKQTKKPILQLCAVKRFLRFVI